MPKLRAQATSAIRLVISKSQREEIEKARGVEPVVRWCIQALTRAIADGRAVSGHFPRPANPVSLYLELPPGLVASINAAAEKCGMLRSTFMRHAFDRAAN